MSWSICLIGKPDKVAEALTAKAAEFTDASKIEYEAALPHLVGIVNQTYGPNAPMLKITANGHGYVNGEQSYNNCQVNVEFIHGNIVV